MTTSALLTLYRSLTRHKLYAILNIGGLALGIAVFLVLFLFVQFERGYDRVLPGAERIWAVNTKFDMPGFPDVNISVTEDTLDELKADFHGIDGARLEENSDVAVKNGNSVTNEDIVRVDPAFFDLFPFPAIEGNPIVALRRPGSAVVTESAARKYVGESSAVGKTITMAIKGQPQVYRIGAVIADMPKDMTYTSDIFVPLPPHPAPEDDFGSSARLFLRFASAVQAHNLASQLPAFVDRHGSMSMGEKASDFMQMTLTPLTAIHLIKPKDKAVMATLGAVGLLTLLIAIVNYINLATARAGLRAREVAVRKVLGGTRASLVVQFLVEAIAMVAVAALIALAVAEVALPFVNAIGGTSLAIHYFGARSILIPLALLVVLVGGVAGLYPAFVLSRFRPAAVLASARTPGGGKGGARLRQALVVVQFAIAIAFTIGTGVLVAQTQHLRHADLGFDRNGLVIVPSFLDDGLDATQRADLLRAFAAIPGVGAVGLSGSAPTGGSFTIMRYKDDEGGQDITVETVKAGPGFFRTYGAHLLAGRLFDSAHPGDDTPKDTSGEHKLTFAHNVIVNATGIRELGFKSAADAIGKPAKLVGSHPPTIIGVVGDMRFASPRDPIQPTLYRFDSHDTEGMVPAIRTAPDAEAAIIRQLEAAWHRIAPAVPFRGAAVDQRLYEQYYQNDAQRGRLFTIGAVLAVLIGCIGLYGLASFDTARRVKEIGIRKVLGASTRDIMRLLIAQFLRPVLLANIIAWPLAFYAMRKWLAGFDDRVALSPVFFITASIVAIAIAAATVFGHAWRVARAEPARALRYE